MSRTVRFLGGSKEQSTWRGHDEPHMLRVGQVYTVASTQVYDWYTTLILDGYPQYRFNSVLCAEVEAAQNTGKGA